MPSDAFGRRVTSPWEERRADHSSASLLRAWSAVDEACDIARRIQADVRNIQQLTKDDRSPVTVADFAVQAVIAMWLRAEFADIPIVGEERAAELFRDENGAVRDAVFSALRPWRDVTLDDIRSAIDACHHDATADRYWTLDPIDGTKGFLRGQQYAIALALIEKGQPVFGVMGCPNLPENPEAPLDEADPDGTGYFSVRGEGSWAHRRNDPGGDGTRLRAAADRGDRVMRVCESAESSHSKHDDTARIISALGMKSKPVRLDSQCKYALVARGQADAYVRLPTSATYVENVWDHAAGALIAGEAGAIVTDIHGRALDFSCGKGLKNNRGIVCAAPWAHARLISAIAELGIDARAKTTPSA
jgi:3'(2'), 5'-bisphosphate nucleotidase